MGNPRTDWMMKTEPEAGLNGRALNYPRGKVLGGCSSINGMIYMRGQAADYDGWRQMGNAGWGWDDVLPYFRKSEDHHGGSSSQHGAGGEWRVERQRLNWPILDAFQAAAEELGIPRVGDFNSGDNFGSGYFEVNQRNGVRWNTSKAFLRPVLHRPNLRVLTGAETESLMLEGSKVIGVRLRHRGRVVEASAGGEVLLSAGAVNSPKLLELSGIGRPEVLQRLGIEVRHRLDGVGENLQDHLQIRTVFKVKNAQTLNGRYHNLVSRAGMGLEYAVQRRGPLSMAPSQFGIFARSNPRLATPDLEYHVQPLSTDRLGEPLHRFDAVTVSVCNLRPDSRGSIHMESPDASAAPEIRPNYLSARTDRQVAAHSIRHARALMRTSAVARFEPEEFLPGPGSRTTRTWRRRPATSRRRSFTPLAPARWAAIRWRGRQSTPSPRPVGSACGRCLDHAADRLGQHQLAGHHDRRKGRGDDPRGQMTAGTRGPLARHRGGKLCLLVRMIAVVRYRHTPTASERQIRGVKPPVFQGFMLVWKWVIPRTDPSEG